MVIPRTLYCRCVTGAAFVHMGSPIVRCVLTLPVENQSSKQIQSPHRHTSHFQSVMASVCQALPCCSAETPRHAGARLKTWYPFPASCCCTLQLRCSGCRYTSRPQLAHHQLIRDPLTSSQLPCRTQPAPWPASTGSGPTPPWPRLL